VAHVQPAVSKVVASGSFTQVERWAEILRSVGVEYLVRWSCDEHRVKRHNRAEMWVDGANVDQARSAIRDASDTDPGLMW
jgi:hypothetical protein